MPLSLMPDYIYQQFTADGKPLSGGTIYFYQSGTLTPKTVYADAAGSTPLGTSVVLSASGTAVIFLDSGAYRIWIKDSTGAPVAPWVDGIVSGGGFGVAGSNATVGFLLLYNDLRALSAGPDVAYVCGRTAEGDGGEGWFQLQPGDTTPDDDGIFLTAAGGSLVYKRVFDAAINPEWYGVKYAINADQSASLIASLGGSQAVNMPVLVTKRVYLTQPVTVPIGASIEAGDDGYFNSPGAVTMTFATGSRFNAHGVTFGDSVQPIFAAETVDAIRLSWFGGSDSNKWARALASASAKFPFLMDVSTALTSDLTIPANLAFEPVGGAVVTFGGFANLSIASLNYAGLAQFVAWTVDSYVGAVSIGSPACYMEWFGGSPANTGNQNAIPFRACLFTEHIDLVPNKTYTVTSSNAITFSNSNTARFNGHGGSLVLNQDIGITVTETNDITISGTGTFNLAAAIFNRSLIIIKTIGGAKSARNSQLFDVNKIVQSNDSTIYGGLVEIGGKLDNCTITLPGTVQVNAGYTFNGCIFGKSESQHLPAFSFPEDPTHAIFQGCHFDIDGALLYSENADLVVDLVSCTDSDNWTKGIHNGYATVNLVGCNCRGNSTATTVDGIGQQLFDPVIATRNPGMRIDIPSQVVTSSLTGWKGLNVGTLTTDGLSIIIGTATTLGSTPWSASTLRFIGSGSGLVSTMGLMDQVWRYGGQMTVKVEYPVGVAPDPAVKLCVAYVCPSIPVGLGMTAHHFFGKSTSVGLAAINAAKSKNYVNIWGGQSTLSAPGIGGPYACVDEWGDATYSVAASAAIPGIPRIVIYNEGSGSVPVGTKITLDLGSYAPTTKQYRTYWPDTPFATIAGVASQAGGGGGISGPGLWATPYVFRSSDANGIEIGKARPDFGTGTLSPTPINLPVTVWTNGTTLNGSY
jgi:hypothetical protein